jgi:outer membrane protein assembly factor BamB
VKVPGSGNATPIVWGDKVFIQTAIPTGKRQAAAADDPAPAPPPPGGRGRGGRGGMGGPKPTEVYQFVILCLDRQTGKTLWQQVANEVVPHEGFRPGDGSFASSSPVTDGKHVFAYFGSRGIHCYDMNGKPLWSRDLGKMKISNGFGEGSSPALSDKSIIVNWDHEGGDSYITALDKETGKVLWKTPRDERTSWSTPLVVRAGGKTQVITTATSKIRSYDADTGKLLWECGGLTRNVIPSPVAENAMLYAMSGFQGHSLLAIHLDRTGDLAGTDAVAWSSNRGTPYVPSPLLYRGRLYFFADNNAVLSCFDVKTGKPLFESQRVSDLQGVYASPVAAGGKVYLVGRNGATVVIKDSEKFELLATNKLDEGIDSSPALAGKEIFLRGHEHLYCIAEK